jgi:hypothetical protein
VQVIPANLQLHEVHCQRKQAQTSRPPSATHTHSQGATAPRDAHSAGKKDKKKKKTQDQVGVRCGVEICILNVNFLFKVQ